MKNEYMTIADMRVCRQVLKRMTRVTKDAAAQFEKALDTENIMESIAGFQRSCYKWMDVLGLLSSLWELFELEDTICEKWFKAIEEVNFSDETEFMNDMRFEILPLSKRLTGDLHRLKISFRSSRPDDMVLAKRECLLEDASTRICLDDFRVIDIHEERYETLMKRIIPLRSCWTVYQHGYKANDVPDLSPEVWAGHYMIDKDTGVIFYGSVHMDNYETIQAAKACLYRLYDRLFDLIDKALIYHIPIYESQQRLNFNCDYLRKTLKEGMNHDRFSIESRDRGTSASDAA